MIGSGQELDELAVHYGVERTFFDAHGTRYDASEDALLAILRSLGAELGDRSDVSQALRARRQALVSEVIEPVVVVWSDRAHEAVLRLPVEAMGGDWTAEVDCEDGERLEASGDVHSLPFHDEWTVEGTRYIRKRFHFGRTVPFGYHRLRLTTEGRTHEALLISAPAQAYADPRKRLWGIFAPTYALRTRDDRGIGTLRELEALLDHTKAAGGQFVGTLPLTATFLDEPFEPSPYAPVSRLFFNELFCDIGRLPELDTCKAARALLANQAFAEEVEALRGNQRVDYATQAKIVRRLLEPLAAEAFKSGVPDGLGAWLEEHPRATPYAMFRAATKKRGEVWPVWPEAMQRGAIAESDVDPAEVEYHTYVQWRMSEQVERLAAGKKNGVGLYLDLPLGVHPAGYDAWAEQDIFLENVATGAPPDPLFVGGQNWGFAPLDPTAARRSEYRYTIECFRHQIAAAGALRIDHVMGLERIYTIPDGLDAKQGVYVHHRSEELYAILTLESHRHQTMIVGEDLGTVPDVVRDAMHRHDLLRMYVMQFSLQSDEHDAIRPAPETAVGSMNTHDTPTFTAFWEGHEIDVRRELGHVSPEDAEAEHEGRRHLRAAVKAFLASRGLSSKDATTREVYGALLEELAKSPARLVLVNLEDLFLERGAQNVPGTTTEHPNWQKKIAQTLEEAFESERIQALLARVDRARSFE